MCKLLKEKLTHFILYVVFQNKYGIISIREKCGKVHFRKIWFRKKLIYI